MSYRVLIVDDHTFIRMALRSLLDNQGYEVIGEAANGADALSLARELVPDLILLDIRMPKLDGIEVIRRVATLKQKIKTIVLTELPADYYAMRCIHAGASAFLSKTEDIHALSHALKTVMGGGIHYPERLKLSTHKDDGQAAEAALISSLSDREMSVLQQLARGMSNKEIAENIMLSNKTVSCYKARLIAKLKVKTVVDLADLARRNELV